MKTLMVIATTLAVALAGQNHGGGFSSGGSNSNSGFGNGNNYSGSGGFGNNGGNTGGYGNGRNSGGYNNGAGSNGFGQGGNSGGFGGNGNSGGFGGNGGGFNGNSGGFSNGSGNAGPQVRRFVSVFVGPEDPVDQSTKTIRVPGGGDKHYNIIFVKAPSTSSQQRTEVLLPESPEQKNLVYVLLKKTDISDNVRVRTPNPTQPSKPEVYFIRYKGQNNGSFGNGNDNNNNNNNSNNGGNRNFGENSNSFGGESSSGTSGGYGAP